MSYYEKWSCSNVVRFSGTTDSSDTRRETRQEWCTGGTATTTSTASSTLSTTRQTLIMASTLKVNRWLVGLLYIFLFSGEHVPKPQYR